MNVTIIHTLAPEVIELFKDFISKTPISQPPAPAPAKVVREKKEVATVDSTVLQPMSQKEGITLQTVRAAAQAKSKSSVDARESVLSLLSEFNVANLTELPESDFENFLSRLNEI